jgi:methylated-DNA-protein-cysteine methyltransferase-like protein
MDAKLPMKPLYTAIYGLVAQIPPGKVATYGQIARMAGRCTARMVGYALSALPPEREDVPWQRVINAQGRISPHGIGIGSALQRALLEQEGVRFSPAGRVDFDDFGWLGPP